MRDIRKSWVKVERELWAALFIVWVIGFIAQWRALTFLACIGFFIGNILQYYAFRNKTSLIVAILILIILIAAVIL